MLLLALIIHLYYEKLEEFSGINNKISFKTLEVSCIGFVSCFSHVWLFATLQTVAHRLLCPWDSLGENTWLIGKDSDAGRDWGQEEKGTTEDEMAGWHHWLDGHDSEWPPGVGDGQGGLALRFMGSQRVWHDWVTELNWAEYRTYQALKSCSFLCMYQMQETVLSPGPERSSEVRNGNPFQYSWLENSMDRDAWRATVHGAAKSHTQQRTS